MTLTRFDISPRMSQAIVHGDTVYLAGQVADDWGADVKEQTSQVLAKIDDLLARTGSNRSRILSAQVWLADAREFDDMNEVWEAWVDPQSPPTRATCGPTLGHQHVRVEITVIAALNG